MKKKQFFKIHSFIGVQLSILFFIVCFSGTCAVFSHEMDYVFDPDIRVQPSQQGRVPFSQMIASLSSTYPGGKINNWIKSNEDYLADIITLETKTKEGLYVYVNPYTGNVQGQSKFNIQRFFRDLHYFMFMPNQIGHYIVLSFGFILFLSMFSGVSSLGKIRKHLKVRSNIKGETRLRAFHRTLGLYVVPFISLISLTGLWYFIERTDLFKISRFIDDITPEAALDKKFILATYAVNYDHAFNVAAKEIPNLKFGSFFYTENLIEIRGTTKFPIVRDRANRVLIDMKDYKVIMAEKSENEHVLKIINNMADPIHFGTLGGLFTKLIWFSGGSIICYLIGSGLWFYLKREYRKHGVLKTSRFIYLNGIVFIFLIYSMYGRIYKQYHADFKSFILVTLYWLVLLSIYYYIYIYTLPKKLKQQLELKSLKK